MSDEIEPSLPTTAHVNGQPGVGVTSHRPRLSIIMANYNCEKYLEISLQSILSQTFEDFEVVLVDDASTDASVDVIRRFASEDPRLRLIVASQNKGPAAARNHALDLAKGEWIAVIDTDDLIHPERFSNLLAVAERTEADIIADNLLVFDDSKVTPPNLHLNWSSVKTISLEAYLNANQLGRTQATLGVLKPVFRSSLLANGSLRYNETLLIAEDADLINYMLARGASMVVVPEAWYLYRKHGQSISRRLTAPKLASMIMATDLFARSEKLSKQEHEALNKLRQSYIASQDFARLVDATKARDLLGGLTAFRRSPEILRYYGKMIFEVMIKRRLSRDSKRRISAIARPQVCFLSSGGILEDDKLIVDKIKNRLESDADIHLICLPDKSVDRQIVKRLPSAALFKTISVQGFCRIGEMLLRVDFRPWYKSFSHKEATQIRNLATNQYFVARSAGLQIDTILCESHDMMQMVPYLLQPEVPSTVL